MSDFRCLRGSVGAVHRAGLSSFGYFVYPKYTLILYLDNPPVRSMLLTEPVGIGGFGSRIQPPRVFLHVGVDLFGD